MGIKNHTEKVREWEVRQEREGKKRTQNHLARSGTLSPVPEIPQCNVEHDLKTEVKDSPSKFIFRDCS